MSQAPKNQDDTAGKKNKQEPEPSDEKSQEPKSKSYAEILKGFEEIEKIFKRDQQQN